MSFAPVLNKLSMSNVDPLVACLVSTIAAGVFAFIYCRVVVGSVRAPFSKAFVAAGVLNGIGLVLLFKSLELLHPAIVTFLSRTYIVFAILTGAFLLNERMTRLQWVLVALTTVGAFSFSYQDAAGAIDVWGVFCVLASALAFTLTNTIVKKKATNIPSASAVLGTNIYSLPVVVFAVFASKSSLSSLSFDSAGLIVLAAFLSGFVGLLLYYEGLKNVSFSQANAIRACSPVLVALLSLPFFKLYLAPLNVIGGALLIMSTVALALSSENKQPTTSKAKPKLVWDVVPDKYDSVLVVPRVDNRFLLVRNKVRGWEFPGGHCEPGEGFLETAKREAYEEAGVIVRDLKTVGHYVLASGHVTVVVTANVEAFVELPDGFETFGAKVFKKLPRNLSFKDGVYEALVAKLAAI